MQHGLSWWVRIAAFLLTIYATTPAWADDVGDCTETLLKTDPDRVVGACRRLAEQGNASAQDALGAMYATGRGVLKAYQQALKWYRRAAEQGLPIAEYNLGACLVEQVFMLLAGAVGNPGSFDLPAACSTAVTQVLDTSRY